MCFCYTIVLYSVLCVYANVKVLHTYTLQQIIMFQY